MKKIKFAKVITENFGPFQERMEIDFIPGKFTFMFGPNGIGKTLLLNAIPFAFFGITSKGERGDEIVNNKSGKNCYVYVLFFIDNDKFEVERYHKYKGVGNTVILKRNGVEVKKGHNEVMPELEHLVCNREIFNNSLFFSQGGEDLFKDLTEILKQILLLQDYGEYREEAKKEKEELKKQDNNIEIQLQTEEKLGEYKKSLLKQIDDAEKIFAAKKEKDLDELNELITQKIQAKKSINDQILLSKTEDVLNKEIQDMQILLAEKTKQINQTEEKIKTITTEATVAKNSRKVELEKIRSERITEINSNYQVLIDAQREKSNLMLDENEKEYKKQTDQFNELRIESNNLQNLINSARNELNEIIQKQNIDGIEICPTCESPITETNIEKVNSKKKKYEDIIATNNEKQKKLVSQISGKVEHGKTLELLIDQIKTDLQQIILDYNNQKNKEIKECENKLNLALQSLNEEVSRQLEQKISQIKKDKDEAIQEIEIWKRHIASNQIDIINLKTHTQLRDRISNEINVLLDKIDAKQNEQFDLTQREKLKQEIHNIDLKIVSFQQHRIKLLDEINQCDFWIKGYSPSGIPNLLIDDSIPYMNERIAEYMEALSYGRYTVSFDTLKQTKAGDFKDKININVLDNFTGANTRKQLSRGQNRLIDIGVLFTVRDLQAHMNGVMFNILLLDEVLDSLDPSNRKITINLLRQLMKVQDKDLCINLISHTQLDYIEKEIDIVLEL